MVKVGGSDDDMSGSDRDDGRGGETVHGGDSGGGSGVTEAGNGSNNAAAEKAQCDGEGALDGNKDELTTVAAEGERPPVTGGKATNEGAPSSPGRLVVAARCGYLLLGFVVGVIAAAAKMFLNRSRSSEPCLVPT